MADILTPAEYEEMVEHSATDPEWFTRRVLGEDPWAGSVSVLEAVRDHKRVAVRSCHGAAKSWTAGRLALWFLYTHPCSIVITTAPTDRQVRGILWKEIKKAHAGSLWPLGGRMLSQSLGLGPDWFAIGFTSKDDASKFQGFHADWILVIVDESCGVSHEINDAVSSILSSENAYRLDIGNPTDPNTTFAAAFKDPGVFRIRISAYDTPNLTEFGITEEDIVSGAWAAKVTGPLPRPYLVTPEWVAGVYQRYGLDHPYYIARVRAEFPTTSEAGLIPMAWYDAAAEGTREPKDEIKIIAVDVARYGSDRTAIYLRHGDRIRLVACYNQASTMETAGWVKRVMRETGADHARVDVIGLGGGVVDRLEEEGIPVVAMNASESAVDPELYPNARTEWYFSLRERFESGDIDVDKRDEELREELLAIRWNRIDGHGRLCLESKDDTKKRLRRSPDRADAVAMAFAPLPPPREPTTGPATQPVSINIFSRRG